jgi:hypothetical protein
MPDNLRFSNPDAIAKPPGYSHVVEVIGPGRPLCLKWKRWRYYRRNEIRGGGLNTKSTSRSMHCTRCSAPSCRTFDTKWSAAPGERKHIGASTRRHAWRILNEGF